MNGSNFGRGNTIDSECDVSGVPLFVIWIALDFCQLLLFFLHFSGRPQTIHSWLLLSNQKNSFYLFYLSAFFPLAVVGDRCGSEWFTCFDDSKALFDCDDFHDAKMVKHLGEKKDN